MRYTPITNNFCGYNFTSIEVDDIDQFPISQIPLDPTGNQGFPIYTVSYTDADLIFIVVSDGIYLNIGGSDIDFYSNGLIYYTNQCGWLASEDAGCFNQKDNLFVLGDCHKFKDLFSFIYFLESHFIFNAHGLSQLAEVSFALQYRPTLRSSTSLAHLFKYASKHSKVKQPSIEKRLKSVKKSGLVYLIELDGCLKVGFSTNLDQRIRSFKTSNSKVNIIATKKGTISDEYRIHSLLKPDLGKELYSLSRIDELLSYF